MVQVIGSRPIQALGFGYWAGAKGKLKMGFNYLGFGLGFPVGLDLGLDLVLA